LNKLPFGFKKMMKVSLKGTNVLFNNICVEIVKFEEII
jgi:hypothetical protein